MKIRILGACCLLPLLIMTTVAQSSSTVAGDPNSSSSDSTTYKVADTIVSESTTTDVNPTGSDSTTVTNSISSPSTTPPVINTASSHPTGSTDTTTTMPSTTISSTGKPSLPKEEVLRQTNVALSNITSSITIFLEALAAITTETPATATTEETTTTGAIKIPVILLFKGEPKILMEATVKVVELNVICNNSITQCKEFLTPLEGIQDKLLKLTTNTDTWEESDLIDLKGLSDSLASEVANKTQNTNFMTDVINRSAAQSALSEFVTAVEEASKAVNAAIADLNKNNDGVIFVAVFCSVGGLIVLALFIGLTVTCVKSKKVKKGSKSKKYSKVPEERVPVEGFKRGLDNDAYHDEGGRGNPQHDSYAMRNVSSRVPAPHSSKTDPHARAPGSRYEDPYAAAPKPKSIADYYSKPGTSRADDYYSRQGPTRDDGHHDRQEASRPDDPYSRPAKGPSQGGLNRYYY